jgi:hypothetical protein
LGNRFSRGLGRIARCLAVSSLGSLAHRRKSLSKVSISSLRCPSRHLCQGLRQRFLFTALHVGQFFGKARQVIGCLRQVAAFPLLAAGQFSQLSCQGFQSCLPHACLRI